MAPEKEAEDKPWSLAKSIEYNFSPEATADLLNLSRWCLAAGLPFTIRHAKWACYLRDAYHARGSNHILAKLVPGMFYSMCDRYAMQDRVSPVINKSLDTIGLDAFISFDSWWEQMTALWVGKLDKVDVMIESETRAKLSIKEPAYGRRADFVILSELDLFNENYGEFIDPNNIDSEIIRIFAYWLRYLSKGTKWVNKSKDERREIAKTLQEEISQEAASVLQGEFGHFFWKPVKLLEVVGYSENKTEKWREA